MMLVGGRLHHGERDAYAGDDCTHLGELGAVMRYAAVGLSGVRS